METDPGKLIPDSCIQTKSESNGSYRITGVQEGVYSLFGCDSSGQQMFLSQVTIDKDRYVDLNGEKVVVHDTEVIRNAGTVILNIPQIADNSTCLFIPGTIIQIPVNTAGECLIKCPPSTIDINLYSNDSIQTLANDINIQEGELINITGNSYVVPSPKIISGLQTGSIGRTYTFTAGSVSLGPNHPVQYRFDWGDDFSVWSSSNQASHFWSDEGTYQVGDTVFCDNFFCDTSRVLFLENGLFTMHNIYTHIPKDLQNSYPDFAKDRKLTLVIRFNDDSKIYDTVSFHVIDKSITVQSVTRTRSNNNMKSQTSKIKLSSKSSVIQVNLIESGMYTIDLFSMDGCLLQRIVNNKRLSAGEHIFDIKQMRAGASKAIIARINNGNRIFTSLINLL